MSKRARFFLAGLIAILSLGIASCDRKQNDGEAQIIKLMPDIIDLERLEAARRANARALERQHERALEIYLEIERELGAPLSTNAGEERQEQQQIEAAMLYMRPVYEQPCLTAEERAQTERFIRIIKEFSRLPQF